MYVNEHIVSVESPHYRDWPKDSNPVITVTTKMQMRADDYLRWRNIQEPLGNAFDLPHKEEIDSTIEHINRPTREKYEYHYWRFVKSSTLDDAEKQFEAMIEQVSMDLQPVGDGKSWVIDPEAIVHHESKKEKPKRTYSKGDMITATWSGMVLAFIIVVSISHIIWGAW